MRTSILVVVTALGSVLGCGGGSGSGGGGGGGGGEPTASGVAIKGPVAGASVTIYELRPTGALGEVVGTGSSNAAGEFSVEVPNYLGWAVACVTGGVFEDEATGVNFSILPSESLYGFVFVEEDAVDYAITPLTTIAFELMQFMAHDPEATVDDDILNALTATENLFGLADVDVALPADLTNGPVAPGPQADYGIVVAGLSELAASLAVSPMALVQALALDAQDGHLDGKAFGANVPLGAGTLPPGAGTAGLAGAIAAFLVVNPRNTSGLDLSDTLVDDELAASTGDFDKPIQIQALADGYGLTSGPTMAELEALSVPANPQVLIEAQLLQVTSQTARELGFEIPGGLALGRHDLVVRDGDTGLVARARDAIEVFDPSAAATVNALAPPAGPLTGGTFLRLSGTNLGPNTLVEVDGVLADRLFYDYPRGLVVATPPHAAGAVDVTVRNGLEVTVVADGFEYRSDDTRSNPSVPSPLAPIVFGAFRNFADATDGLTAQALFGRSTFTDFDTGTFTLTDFTATELAPTIMPRSRGGSTFQSNESLGKAFLLSDTANGLSDFIRGFTHEENGVSLGATAFGPACFFPEPTGMQIETVARAFWINGLETDLTLGRVRQKSGWLELDAVGSGSANLLAHGRDYGGSGFDLGAETWSISFNLSASGSFQGSRTVGSASGSLVGRFSAGADLGFLILNASEGTVLGYYLLTPIEHGIEGAGWGGWAGGSLALEIADDGTSGLESAFESGTYRGQIAGTAEGYSRLALNRTTRLSPSDPEGSFRESVEAIELDLSPAGRLYHDDNQVGFVNGGILLATGDFPNDCLLEGGLDRSLVLGGAVFRDSRKSLLSLEPDRKQIAIEAKFLEGVGIRRQELGTDFFDLALAPDVPPSIGGVSIPLAGTIPVLAATTIAGIHKATVRDATGAATTTRGAPPAWGVTVGYSFIDDTLDLFATEITEPSGRFGGASMPRWIASGTLGNDGQVATLRTSDEFLGDGLLFLVADRGVKLAEPNFAMTALGLAFDPNEGGLSGVTSSQAELGFAGNGNVTVTLLSQTMREDGTFTPGSAGGQGLNTAPSSQSIRLNLPNGVNPDRVWQTFWTPSGDAFFGIEDSSALDTAEIVLGIRPAMSGSFVDDDRSLIVLVFDPVISRATTQQLFLKPRVGTILSGELFTSRRDPAHALLPGQSFVATSATDTGSGEARVPLIGQVPVLGFLFNGRDEAAGQAELNLFVTPRIIHSLDY